jgi:hypothetical protein
MAEAFTYKITTESELFTFDFNPVLQSGESITTASSNVIVMNGVDLNPNAILSGTPTWASGKVNQRIAGGISEVTYRIEVTADTNQGNVYVCVGDLPIYDASLV